MFRGRDRIRSNSLPIEASAAKRKSAPGTVLRPTPVSVTSRSKSLPTKLGKAKKIKGILKITTHDESLHSKYQHAKGEECKEESPESVTGSTAVTSSASSDQQRQIQFENIIIREYARTVGDNPSCSSGPPVSIAWEYDPNTKIISVDNYEENRPPRRSHFQMILPREVRQQMLRKEWDVTQRQIAEAVRNNIKVKNQRRATINNLSKAPAVEEMIESATRTLKRGLFLRKSTSKQVEKLASLHRAAQQARMDEFFNDSEEPEQDDEEESGNGPEQEEMLHEF